MGPLPRRAGELSPPPGLSFPCVLFALRRESAPFRRTFRLQRPVPAAPGWARWCVAPPRAVLVLETGVGPRGVDRALDWLFGSPTLDGRPYQPTALVFAGFAGSLSPALRVGDVILPEAVVDERGRHWPTTWPTTERRGRLLTATRLISTPAEKWALGERHRAAAVDMESATFARRCAERGLPFGCLRAISDDVDTALSPALVPLLAGGVVSPWRFAAALLRHPGMLPELLRLARHTRLAAKRLGVALSALLV